MPDRIPDHPSLELIVYHQRELIKLGEKTNQHLEEITAKVNEHEAYICVLKDRDSRQVVDKTQRPGWVQAAASVAAIGLAYLVGSGPPN